jgi:hypothetical protein
VSEKQERRQKETVVFKKVVNFISNVKSIKTTKCTLFFISLFSTKREKQIHLLDGQLVEPVRRMSSSAFCDIGEVGRVVSVAWLSVQTLNKSYHRNQVT